MSDERDRDDELLTRAILARTSGQPCASARDRLAGFADGELDGLDTELLRMHVAGCADCAALTAVLRGLSADLPLLAEVEPAPGFVAAVLARTEPRAALATRAARWLGGALAAGMRRPRFAWEAAYVATFVVALVFTVPGSPLASVPEIGRGLARINPVVEIARPAGGLRRGVSSRVAPLVDRSLSEARAAWIVTRDGWSELRAALAAGVERELGTLWDRDASAREGNEQDEHDEGE
jgi:hypothetical protein